MSDFDSATSVRHPPPHSPRSNWSEDQLIRLEYEWRRLQRSFAYHPHVRVMPLQDDPPGEYEIEYRVRTLGVGEAGQLEYVDAVQMRLWLPPTFPYADPVMRPITGLFHPNISWEGVHLSAPWQPTDTLADFVRRVGELLAWRSYDPEMVVNPVAMDWLDANADALPLDPAADFSAEADGEPLDRICRHGSATIDQIHKQLDQIRDAMLEVNGAPGLSDVREFSRRTRQTLNLFMDSEIPDSLRYEASDLDEWARELPASVPVWDSLRYQRAAVQAVRAARTALADKREPLQRQIKAVESLAPATAPTNASSAMAAIPERKAMEVVQLKLPGLVRETDDLLHALHERVKALDMVTPVVAVREDSALGRQLQAEQEAAAAGVRSAREEAAETISAMEPLLERAHAEATAIKQIGLWREYLDLFTTGDVLEHKIVVLGASGVHAHFIENASGVFGPFQHDQPIDLGAKRLAIRSTARNRVRLVDVASTEVVGRSDAGSLVVDLVSPETREHQLTTFRLTERWEDLAVQFDFLVRQSGQLIVKLTASFPKAPSWCGRVLNVLSTPESIRIVREQHRRSSHEWRSLLQDLGALGPVKARIETWNFVRRIAEVVPNFLQRMAEQKAQLDKSVNELASIVSRCKRDVDTDRLIILPKLAAPYAEQTALRDGARREIDRIQKLLVQLGSQIARQLASQTLVGSANVPQFQLMPAFQPALEEAIASMDDMALLEQVEALEQMLNMPLKSDAWQPSREPVRRPAAPRPTAEATPLAPVSVAQVDQLEVDSEVAPPETDGFVIEPVEEPGEDEEGRVEI